MKVLVSVASLVSVLGSVIERNQNWKICQIQDGENGIIQSEHPFKQQFFTQKSDIIGYSMR